MAEPAGEWQRAAGVVGITMSGMRACNLQGRQQSEARPACTVGCDSGAAHFRVCHGKPPQHTPIHLLLHSILRLLRLLQLALVLRHRRLRGRKGVVLHLPRRALQVLWVKWCGSSGRRWGDTGKGAPEVKHRCGSRGGVQGRRM